ncbi:PLD nuclease N-terminal domain-containing protein [Glutamicibacter sp. JC586]|uniref:PLD nuclease N-terminal domain-containing protein n=1 Tax=Glutamicibacter sp. JC586 TaxID=2590552 RepID=UPI00135A6CC4|nr:PLD nuclease N-terminal domain-containing protein [Glutamicibacter sp. JC586]
MVRFIIFAAVVSVALMIYTLIECSRAEKHQVRSLPKSAWVVVIILLPLIGAVLWFVLGRPQSSTSQSTGQQKAPDDDEDFLRQLEVWRRQQQRETDAKAREQELKDQAKKKPDADDTDSDTPDTKA